MPSLLTKLKLQMKYLQQEKQYVIGPFTILLLIISFVAVMFLALDPAANQVQLLVYIGMLVGACVIVIFEHETGYAKVQIRINQLSTRSIVGGGIGLVALIIGQAIFGSLMNPGSLWTRNLLVWVAASPEEMLFRVAIMGWFISQGSLPWILLGLLAQAIIFALFHYVVYSISNPLIFGLLFYGGLSLGVVFLIWRNSDAPTLGHVGNNILSTLH